MPSSTQIGIGIAAIIALAVGFGSQRKLPSFRSTAEATSENLPHGYIAAAALPDSLALLPPPPADGSEAMGRDLAAREAALEMKGTPRYALAVADSDRSQDSTAHAFQCALGTEISREGTPNLYSLLAKVRLDTRAASYRAKQHYKRPRPFVVYNARSCAPDEQLVQNDGSYPSARGAVGWAYALVLAKVDPSRHDAIFKRGREFAQSRVICDSEWQSDVEAGKLLAAEAVKRMLQSEAFRADLNAARKEVADAGRPLDRLAGPCTSELAAIASR